jgi:hypothetical protein
MKRITKTLIAMMNMCLLEVVCDGFVIEEFFLGSICPLHDYREVLQVLIPIPSRRRLHLPPCWYFCYIR